MASSASSRWMTSGERCFAERLYHEYTAAVVDWPRFCASMSFGYRQSEGLASSRGKKRGQSEGLAVVDWPRFC